MAKWPFSWLGGGSNSDRQPAPSSGGTSTAMMVPPANADPGRARAETHDSDEDLVRLFQSLQGTENFKISRTFDRMDDQEIITLSVSSSYQENAEFDHPINLVFRVKRDRLTSVVDAFFYFDDNYFFRKGAEPRVRIRYDDAPPRTLEPNLSTNRGSLFLEGYKDFRDVWVRQIKLEVVPTFGNVIFATFDMSRAMPGLVLTARAMLGKSYKEILQLNPQIVDSVLRFGPKNVLYKKMALRDLGFFRGEIDYAKPIEFYAAICAYARSRHASEYFGILEGEGVSRRPNTPWSAMLYQEASERVKALMGPLYIND